MKVLYFSDIYNTSFITEQACKDAEAKVESFQWEVIKKASDLEWLKKVWDCMGTSLSIQKWQGSFHLVFNPWGSDNGFMDAVARYNKFELKNYGWQQRGINLSYFPEIHKQVLAADRIKTEKAKGASVHSLRHKEMVKERRKLMHADPEVLRLQKEIELLSKKIDERRDIHWNAVQGTVPPDTLDHEWNQLPEWVRELKI